MLLQAANGRQTPAQAQGGLLQAGHCGWHSSQHLRGQQLEAYQPPVEEMTDQQLETALRDTQWEEAFAVNPAPTSLPLEAYLYYDEQVCPDWNLQLHGRNFPLRVKSPTWDLLQGVGT